MKKAPILANEEMRLKSLLDLQILDTLPEEVFQNITELASAICETPIALISLIDSDRQWFKARVGLSATQTPRDVSFCGHAIHQDNLFLVEDSDNDQRFSDNPLVLGEPKVKFYAGFPIKAENGLGIGTVCVIDHKVRKLNDWQKSALKKLAHQVQILMNAKINEKKQNKLTKIMQEGYVVQRKSGEIIDFNQAALRILDLTEDELTGRTSMDPRWQAIKENGEDFPGEEHPAMVSLKTGQPVFNTVMGIRKKEGGKTWIMINAVPLYDSNESIESRQVLTTFTDITTTKVAIEKLIYSSKMSSLGEMASSVAHEINNPLSVVKNRSELALKNLLDDEKFDKNYIIQNLEKVISVTERIAKIISGLRSFSRSSEKDPKVYYSLKKIMNETIDLCSEKLKSHSIQFHMSEIPEINLLCRPTEISQILFNLISNAIDAIKAIEKKWIHINFEYNSKKLSIIVIDCGNGIPETIRNKIMEPFYTTKAVGEGTGLGLSISQGLAKDNNAELICVADAVNTTFVLQFSEV